MDPDYYERECRRLNDQLSKSYDQIVTLTRKRDFWLVACVDAQNTADAALRAKMSMEDERDELRDLVVWLARERIRAEYLPNCGVVAVLTDREWAEYPCDGTPTSIIEALRRAKEGRGDGVS